MIRFDSAPTVLLAVAIGVCASCAGRHKVSGPSDQACVRVTNAQDVRKTMDYDGGIHYIVPDPYPASVTIDVIGTELSGRGWQMTNESVLGDAKEREARTWWSYHRDDETKVYQWNGSWRNGNADMVSYFLQYQVSPINAPAVLLQVDCIYLKSTTVEQLRKAAKR